MLMFWSISDEFNTRIELRVFGLLTPEPHSNLAAELRIQDGSNGQDLGMLSDCRVDITDAQQSSPGSQSGAFAGTGECMPTGTLSVSEFSFVGFGALPE
jgi:hypothetical protein